MAELKRVWTTVKPLSCDALARYMEYMAEQGWRFTKWEDNCLIFEKNEAEKAVYDVVVYSETKDGILQLEKKVKNVAPDLEEKVKNVAPDLKEKVKNGTPDPKEEAKEEEKEAGWEWIDGHKGICFLKRAKEDATPILTDAQKLENVEKASRHAVGEILTSMFIILACAIFICFVVFYSLSSSLFYNSHLLLPIALTVLAFIYLAMFVYMKVRFIRLKKKVDAGEKIFFGRMSKKNPRIPVGIHTNLLTYYLQSIAPIAIILLIALFFKDTIITFATLLVIDTFRFIRENIRPKEKRYKYYGVIVLLSVALAVFYVQFEYGALETRTSYQEYSKSIFGYSSIHNYIDVGDDSDDYCEYSIYHLNSFVPDSVVKMVWDDALDDEYESYEYHVSSLKEKYHADDAAFADEDEYQTLALRFDHDILLVDNPDLLTDQQMQELIDKLE